MFCADGRGGRSTGGTNSELFSDAIASRSQEDDDDLPRRMTVPSLSTDLHFRSKPGRLTRNDLTMAQAIVDESEAR